MSVKEMVFAKSEFKKVRKKYTDGLQIKGLKENNEEYKPESLSGCLALVLLLMTDIQKGRLEVPQQGPKKLTYEESIFFVRGVIFESTCVPVPDFV